jgi:lipoprotein-anchoring transpeptidase ErfK/SrfK
VLALVAGGATALVLTMPHLAPASPTTLTNDATPTLRLHVTHPLGVDATDVVAKVDGTVVALEDIHVAAAGSDVEVDAPHLADGRHAVLVQVHHAGVLRTTVASRWNFTVDTAAPAERIVAPKPSGDGASAYVAADVAAVTKLPLQLTVGAEPGSTLTVSSDAPTWTKDVTAKGAADTRRNVALDLPQGAQQLTVVSADRAGNETTRTLRVLVDTKGPALTLRTPRLVRDQHLALPLAASDTSGVSVTVKLDGSKLEDALDEVSTTDAPFTPAATDTTDTTVEATPDPAPIAGRWTLTDADGAFEGRHVLDVTATDSLGTTTTVRRMFFVDSTEDLGAAAGLRPGAHGADVIQLHDALVERQVATRAQLAPDARTRTYGAATLAAVKRYQTQDGIEADGVAGTSTIAGLTLKIVVNRETHTLTLYRIGKVVKSWGVAVGQPAYPTPTGNFKIQNMQKDPTWTPPPDSPWAKGAKPIAAGPDNPLGTRWMAVDGTVGIHGTNNPASIGYSQSHGCIRMRIPDVEELFDMVSVGTPVQIV